MMENSSPSAVDTNPSSHVVVDAAASHLALSQEPSLLTELADAAMNINVHEIPWVADALNISATLASEPSPEVSQGDAVTPATLLTTQELLDLDDQFIRRYTQPEGIEDDILDATDMAIDEALDAAQVEELADIAVTRAFDVEPASTVFSHLDDSIFWPSPMATADNIVARPLEFASTSGTTTTPNFAALYPVHMLAAILEFFPLPSHMPGAWATITLLVYQLIGHLQLLVEGLSAILRCPICLQILQRPYVLECGHVVCEHCLHNYFTTILNDHVVIHPSYITRHRSLAVHIFFFYNSEMSLADRHALRARILTSLASLVRPTYECPICRTIVCRPPIFVYALADVIDIALLLGASPPDDIYNSINHHDWRDFFVTIG